MTDAIEVLASPGLTPHERIDRFEAAIIDTPQPEAEFLNYFGPGVYMRGMKMSAYTVMPDGEVRQNVATGCEHREACLNFIVAGRLEVFNEQGVGRMVCAGECFESPAGTRRAVKIWEDAFWLTIHANPTNERDVAKMIARLTKPSCNPLLADRNVKCITGGIAS